MLTVEPHARRRGRRSWIARAGWLAAGCLALTAAPVRAGEAATKADYLWKFLGYVEWPAGTYASPDTPHVVAVLRADDVLAELERLAAGRGAAPGNRRVVVRKVLADDPLAGVHLLHVGRGARPPDPALLRLRPVLVVTDSPAGMPDYAALNFVTVDRRVRFEAAPVAAERVGLKLSARLLAVTARVVAPP
jgi:hypothetical protein